MSEAALVRRILLAYGRTPTIRLFRNSVGVGIGLHHPGTITYGLCPGSSDIIGLRSTTGPLKLGQFLAIECKAGRGRLRPEQEAFLAMVLSMGGIAIVARSLDDVIQVLGPPLGGPTTTRSG